MATDREPNTVEIFRDAGRDRERFEAELLARGVTLPLQGRTAWARKFASRTLFFGVRDSNRAAVWGFAALEHRTRALPGYSILHVPRFGHGVPDAAVNAGVLALTEFAKRKRILRVQVDTYSPDPDERLRLRGLLADHRFQKEPPCRTYRRTAFVDLRPTEDAIFATFSKGTRRDTRSVSEFPVSVQRINDPSLTARMNCLGREAMGRTGAQFSPVDWARWMQFCGEHPELACLVGMFRTDRSDDEALLAYALAYNHGDTVEYAHAASTRNTDLKVPQLYAPVWLLMQWGKATGAIRFDFGGISWGSLADGDVRGGISDFKRNFSKDVVEVSEEFTFEPSAARSAAASFLRTGYAVLTRLGSRRRRKVDHA